MTYDANFKAKVDAYVDADWASDTLDRKSTTGILIRVYNNPILWKSLKQKVVSRASIHAEFYAIADCVEEILPIRGLLLEMGIKIDNAINVFEDNTGAISLEKNEKLMKIPSDDQIAMF